MDMRGDLNRGTCPRLPERQAIAIAMLLGGAAITGGCATPYLHDPAVETQTAAVKEAYGKIANETYFKDLRVAFAALQTEGDDVRTQILVADRDRHLTSAINPTDLDAFQLEGGSAEPLQGYPGPTVRPLLRCIPESSVRPVPTRGPQVLCRRSLERLHELIGECPEDATLSVAQERWSQDPRLRVRNDQGQEMHTVCADRLGRLNLELWAELPDNLRGLFGSIASDEDAVAQSLKAFLEKRTKWYVELQAKAKEAQGDASAGAPPATRRKPPKGQKTEAEEAEGPAQPKVKLACEDLLKYATPLDATLGLAAFPGYPVPELNALRDSCAALEINRAALRPGGILYRQLTPMASGERVRIDENSGKTAPARGWPLLVQLENQARSAREARAAAKTRAAAVEVAIKGLQEQVKKRGAPDWQLQAKVKELKEALGNAPAAAKLVGAEGLGELLEDLLKVELQAAAATAGATQPAVEAGAADETSARTAKIEAVLGAVSALESVENAIRLGDPGQRVSALLLAITAERQKADMAALEQQRAIETLKILEAQELTLLTEAAFLSETLVYAYGRGLLREPRGIVAMQGRERNLATSALNRYSLSWSEGRIPYNLLEQRKTYVNREFRIRMAEKTAANWQALIQPAVAQLSAAGSGGIKPELIAGLLGRLGIGTAILED